MNRSSSGGSLGPFCRLGQHPGREVGSDGRIQSGSAHEAASYAHPSPERVPGWYALIDMDGLGKK